MKADLTFFKVNSTPAFLTAVSYPVTGQEHSLLLLRQMQAYVTPKPQNPNSICFPRANMAVSPPKWDPRTIY